MAMIINAETRGLTHRVIWCRIYGDEKSDRDHNFRFVDLQFKELK